MPFETCVLNILYFCLIPKRGIHFGMAYLEGSTRVIVVWIVVVCNSLFIFRRNSFRKNGLWGMLYNMNAHTWYYEKSWKFGRYFHFFIFSKKVMINATHFSIPYDVQEFHCIRFWNWKTNISICLKIR